MDVAVVARVSDVQFVFAVRAFEDALPVLPGVLLADRVDDCECCRHLLHLLFPHIEFLLHFLLRWEPKVRTRALRPAVQLRQVVGIGLEARQTSPICYAHFLVHLVIGHARLALALAESREVDASKGDLIVK